MMSESLLSRSRLHQVARRSSYHPSRAAVTSLNTLRVAKVRHLGKRGWVGVEQRPEYYDSKLERVLLPLEVSPWLPVYEVAVDLLPPPATNPSIADLGCGTGRFAKLLRDRGYSDYWGVDFSAVRVAEARRYVPGWSFDTGDLFAPEVRSLYQKHDTFVVLEVLEHLRQDVSLLKTLPSGARIVFSVPTYDSGGHVRTFKNPDAISSRYASVLHLAHPPTVIEKRNDRKIYVSRGTVR